MNAHWNENSLLTVPEGAEYLRLSTGTVYHYISEGRLPVVRLSSRCVRFRFEDLRKWVEDKASPADDRNGKAISNKAR